MHLFSHGHAVLYKVLEERAQGVGVSEGVGRIVAGGAGFGEDEVEQWPAELARRVRG